jgi:hypothetical protein
MAEVPDVGRSPRPALHRIDLELVRARLSAGEYEDGLTRLGLMVGTILPRLVAEPPAAKSERD